MQSRTQNNTNRRLGRLLRDARKRRHLTGAKLGAKAGLSQSKISKLENGYPEKISPEDIENIVNILQPSMTIRHHIRIFMEQEYSSVSAQRVYTFHYANVKRKSWYEAQRKAEMVRGFLVSGVPAVLQTTAYREATLRSVGLDEKELGVAMKESMMRQDMLWDKPTAYRFVLLETALYTMPADATVQLAQLDRLDRLIGVSHIEIGVIPVEMGMTTFETGSFMMYDEDIVVKAVGESEIETTERETIMQHVQAFTDLDQKATHGEEARALIRKAISYFGG